MKTNDEIDVAVTEVKEVMTDILKNVVRKDPEAVRVTNVYAGGLVAFVIKTEQEDVGRIMGTQGKHFKALTLLATEAMRRIGVEVAVTVDEKTPARSEMQPIRDAQKTFGDYRAKKFKSVSSLLKRTVSLFAENKGKVSVSATDVANMTILECKVAEEDYASVYGKKAEFDYGEDGNIIGAIKNMFDAVGKNNGRVVRIHISHV